MNKPSVDANPTLPIQDDDHVAGPDTAAIILVVYCDFECPYCGRAYPIIKRLRARLTESLRVVFRHFPLIHKHPLAQHVAEAAAEGKFWEMADQRYDGTDDLETLRTVLQCVI